MRLNLKKITVVGLVFIVIVITATLLFGKPGSQPPAPQIIVPPAPTLGIAQPTGVVFTFSSPPSIPDSLPTYEYTDYTTAQLAASIQNNLDTYHIPDSPSSLTRSGVFSQSWLGDGAEFVLSDENGSPTISFQQFKAEPPPSPVVLPAAAGTNFITKLLNLPQGVTLTQTQTINDVSEGLLILDSFIPSSIRGMAFSYLINNYPIVYQPHAPSPAVVAIDNYGIIRAASVIPPPQTITPSSWAQLLNASGITANLNQGRGQIISSGRVDFKSFTINSVEIVYSKSGGLLYPAFILRGEGINSSGSKQEVEFFLWATSQQ